MTNIDWVDRSRNLSKQYGLLRDQVLLIEQILNELRLGISAFVVSEDKTFAIAYLKVYNNYNRPWAICSAFLDMEYLPLINQPIEHTIRAVNMIPDLFEKLQAETNLMIDKIKNATLVGNEIIKGIEKAQKEMNASHQSKRTE